MTLANIDGVSTGIGSPGLGAGALLRRRLAIGRQMSLALAVVNLLILPFGTALGVYALWILLTSDGRRLFEPHPVVAATPR